MGPGGKNVKGQAEAYRPKTTLLIKNHTKPTVNVGTTRPGDWFIIEVRGSDRLACRVEYAAGVHDDEVPVFVPETAEIEYADGYEQVTLRSQVRIESSP
jgi:hypothetical protein